MIRDLGVGIGIDIDTGPLAKLDQLVDEVAKRLSKLDFSAMDETGIDHVSKEFDDLEKM